MKRNLPCLVLAGLCASAAMGRADQLDNFIIAKMRERQIPGLSLAIVENGTIVRARGYGFTDKSKQTAVTPDTLFQAGSVSKSVAALGALHLVEQRKLSLDEDVNTKLQSWKVPENRFTASNKVTLRRILSHSAGFNVHGFPGYATNAAMPTLLQVLNGIKPANTAAIRVVMNPGEKWQYSGGGYTVMQQLIIDITEEAFPKFMHDTVLQPLGMTNSTYEQPLPPGMTGLAATGYFTNGNAVSGHWHVYPELAAAGLWTTASDLARFLIGIQHNTVLSPEMTHTMLTPQNPALSNDGLGVFVHGSENSLRFLHGGRNAGFDSQIFYFPNIGAGVVIMINANDNKKTVIELIDAIARKNAWPGFVADDLN